ncbi:LptA/OstA family protein [Chroococcidiopsis sp. CCMEE 29]|uniref:LptA/OstA family protein n=1 Tax=Chroococcidiopsis sp. CCMEE 29 TaxID=155894 RepID=UPI002020A996|nr:LptA/OstA family protein [Chroococcidiopsis sp. CCMEE 29]
MMPSSRFRMRRLGLAWILPAALVSAIAFAGPSPSAKGQTPADGRALSINSDTQEANSQTGVFTARGNVQINYPARQVQATAAQAQYFSRERKIVLNGDVYVLQQGNSIRGETVTYLIDEGRFIATPKANAQVESIYVVSDPDPTTQPSAAPQTPPLNPNPASKTPAGVPAPRRQ